MKSDIKIKDLIQVWSYESLSHTIFEVYDIYYSEYGGYVYECFRIKLEGKDNFKRETFTYLIHHKDVVAKFSPINKIDIKNEN